ncbi:DNA oxidative demethylase ALKBH2 [Lasiodiplodia theobromae]|uniref:DNA oxidative demethylase ALKBH2 n=1 Tax=Lasiodiplodia theobromae TaxID=45133 RepID=A0A5N5DPV8_9PEZI|nr:DNA oxidative demethylase ALKBH2 [Lasiodiplodia theobromae]
MLAEAPTFGRDTFKLFDRVVESPHSICFYVDSWDEAVRQKNDYIYNGSRITDIRRTLPEMDNAKAKVQTAVNAEIKRRIEQFQGGAKLKHQSPHEWVPNASFVNCYDGGSESVGYHSDQLTYVGPRAVIGSLSLGVAREFRVRKVVARDDSSSADEKVQKSSDTARADAEGQIAIHLPHNSLLVMHAAMQEEWKHSIAPAQAIDPHPVAGNKRINITYRHYKENLHPRYTPRCKCNVPTVLRCVQRKKENRGRYMWMCHTSYSPGQEGCSFFQWAEFDDDGEPPWAKKIAKEGGDEIVSEKSCKEKAEGLY